MVVSRLPTLLGRATRRAPFLRQRSQTSRTQSVSTSTIPSTARRASVPNISHGTGASASFAKPFVRQTSRTSSSVRRPSVISTTARRPSYLQVDRRSSIPTATVRRPSVITRQASRTARRPSLRSTAPVPYTTTARNLMVNNWRVALRTLTYLERGSYQRCSDLLRDIQFNRKM